MIFVFAQSDYFHVSDLSLKKKNNKEIWNDYVIDFEPDFFFNFNR